MQRLRWRSKRSVSEKGTRKDAAGAMQAANQAGRGAQPWCVEREQGSRSALAGRRAIPLRVAPVTICTGLQTHTRPSNFSSILLPSPSAVGRPSQRNIEARSLGRDSVTLTARAPHRLPINALLRQTSKGGAMIGTTCCNTSFDAKLLVKLVCSPARALPPLLVSLTVGLL